jgi:hypothetical protein
MRVLAHAQHDSREVFFEGVNPLEHPSATRAVSEADQVSAEAFFETANDVEARTSS